VTPTTLNIPTTESASLLVTLTSLGGFTDTVSLGCLGLPASVNCHFSNIDVTVPSNGSNTAQLTIDTNNPLGGGASAQVGDNAKTNCELADVFLPFSLAFGWFVWQFRKRHSGILIAVLAFVVTGAAVLATGCGGFTQISAAPGTYVIQVAGVGTNSNVTEYQTVTLSITK